MNVVEEKWNEIIEHLRVEHELSHISFSTWIQPLKVYCAILSYIYNQIFVRFGMSAMIYFSKVCIFFQRFRKIHCISPVLL